MEWVVKGKDGTKLFVFSIWPYLELSWQVPLLDTVRKGKRSNNDETLGKRGAAGKEESIWSQDLRCYEISIREAEEKFMILMSHASRTIQAPVSDTQKGSAPEILFRNHWHEMMLQDLEINEIFQGEQVEWEGQSLVEHLYA